MAEQPGQAPSKVREFEQADAGIRFEFRSKVHVAVSFRSAACDGAEQGEPVNTRSAQLRLMCPHDGDYALS